MILDVVLDFFNRVSPSLTLIFSSRAPDLTLDGSLVIVLHHWSGNSRRGTKVFLVHFNFSVDLFYGLSLYYFRCWSKIPFN